MRKIDGRAWLGVKNVWFDRVFLFLTEPPPSAKRISLRDYALRSLAIALGDSFRDYGLRSLAIALGDSLRDYGLRSLAIALGDTLRDYGLRSLAIDDHNLTFTIGISNGLLLKPKTIVIAKF